MRDLTRTLMLLILGASCGPSRGYQDGSLHVVAHPGPGAQPAEQPVASYDSPGPSTPIAPPSGQVSSAGAAGAPGGGAQGQPIAAPSVEQPIAAPPTNGMPSAAAQHATSGGPPPGQPIAPPSSPPFSDPACTNSCSRARDGVCDDGRPGAADRCAPGTDCIDCGAYAPDAPVNAGCVNTCRHAGDDECDDGRPGSETDLCAYGTDCNDCGPTSSEPALNPNRSGRSPA